jgi:transposase InsO family protein
MREAGVWVRYRRRYRLMTESRHRHPVFPNRLQRCFHVAAPNRVWASDISYGAPSPSRQLDGCGEGLSMSGIH